MKINRQFRMHSDLLRDIIKRQAGTLSKAIMEAVMNSVDARATECRITVNSKQIVIQDNGVGIQSREELESVFETFGGYTEAQRSEKTFGAFRMGRGQLMSFGVNTWRTGQWKMTVDINSCDEMLGYKLQKMKAKAKGCKVVVDLYEELAPSALGDLERGVIEGVKFCRLPIRWNNRKINKDPAKEKWDFTLEDAYIKLNERGSISVYNLGIHTMELPSYRFGTGGVIVSRQQLQVNFARNDVMDSCPVWQRIRPFVKGKADEKIKKAKKLNRHERQRLADQIRDGDVAWGQVQSLKLLTLVNNRTVALKDLGAWRYGRQVTACKAGSVIGDTLLKRRVALVLSTETLERFGVETVDALLRRVQAIAPTGYFKEAKAVPFSHLVQGMDKDYVIFQNDELTETEQLWLELATRAKRDLVLQSEFDRKPRHATKPYDTAGNIRKIMIGQGPCNGWTDGRSFVAICRTFLQQLEFDIPGFGKLGRLLLHEFCHGDSSACTHVHGEEFYEEFHDAADTLGDFIDKCVTSLPAILDQRQKRATKKMLLAQDKLARLAKAQVPAASTA